MLDTFICFFRLRLFWYLFTIAKDAPLEDEAYYLEEQLSKAFWDNNISGTQDVDL